MMKRKITNESIKQSPLQFFYKEIEGKREGIYKPVNYKDQHLRIIVMTDQTFWINTSTNCIYSVTDRAFIPPQLTNNPLIEAEENITISFTRE